MTTKYLYIRAVEATDIPKMDAFGKCDPYLVFKLNSDTTETWKTKHIQQTYEPHWDEIFRIPIKSGNAVNTLHAELYDYDSLSSDDPISSHDFQISTSQLGKVIDEWYDFFPLPKVKKGGRVHLIFHLANENDFAFQAKDY